MAENIDPIIADDEQDETQRLLEIIEEVLNEKPEYRAACERILQKLDERMTEELQAMRHVAHNIANLQPGSTRKQ